MPKCSSLSLTTTTTTLSPCGTCTSRRMHCVKSINFNIKISTDRKCACLLFRLQNQPGANQWKSFLLFSLLVFSSLSSFLILQQQPSEIDIPLVAADLWSQGANVDLLESFSSPDPTTQTHTRAHKRVGFCVLSSRHGLVVGCTNLRPIDQRTYWLI